MLSSARRVTYVSLLSEDNTVKADACKQRRKISMPSVLVGLVETEDVCSIYCVATGSNSTSDLNGMPSIDSFPLLLARTVTPTGFAFTASRVSIAARMVSPIRRIVSTIRTLFPSTWEKLGLIAPATFFSPSRCGRTDAIGFLATWPRLAPRPLLLPQYRRQP